MPPVEGAGSSPAEETVSNGQEAQAGAVAAVDTSSDGSSAATSTAGVQDEKSRREELLNVTLGALKQPAEGDGASSGPDKAKDKDASAEAGTKAEGEAGAETEGEELDADLPFHKHPRWQKLRSDLKAATDRASAAEADADQYRRIEAFRAQANLEPVEVADGYKVMALIKNDPAAALPVLKGYVEAIEQHLGMVLPADLQEEVDSGAITEERARELSQARATTANLSAAEESRRRTSVAERERQAVQRRVDAVSAWETETRQRDPDFAALHARVMDRVAFLMSDPKARPTTPEASVALAKQAYQDVKDGLKGFVQPRTPTRQTPEGASAATATRAPKTPLEITKAAIGMAF